MLKSTIIIPALWLGLFFWGEKRRERKKNPNNSLLASSLIAGYLCIPASSVWNFSTLTAEEDFWFADPHFHLQAAVSPPCLLGYVPVETKPGPAMYPLSHCPFSSLTFLPLHRRRSCPCVTWTGIRSPANQSSTRMNRNPQRIRELSHPVSSFDWIVSWIVSPILLNSMRIWH